MVERDGNCRDGGDVWGMRDATKTTNVVRGTGKCGLLRYLERDLANSNM